MERETKKFTTPSGKEVVVKSYITGGEANQVKEGMLKEMKMDVSGENQNTEISGAFLLEQEKKLLGILVVSIDGKAVTSEELLNLRNEDYQFIVKEANAIYSGNLTPAK